MAKPFPKEAEAKECLGIVRMLEVLKDLNPEADFCLLNGDILTMGIHPWEIKCPEGYHITDKNVLTNGDEKTCGCYDAFQII